MGKRVYVAGPISKGNAVRNIRKAIEVAEVLRRAGHFPFVPHLTTFHWYFLYMNELSLDDSSWRNWNFSWLECCDYMIRLPGESTGSDAEEVRAREIGVQVFGSAQEFLFHVSQFPDERRPNYNTREELWRLE